MQLTKTDLAALSRIAIEAATQAGALIRGYTGKDVTVSKKATGSNYTAQVVTEVDLKSQELILKHIAPTCARYDLGLLCEEGADDLSRLRKDYFWCIDPLDGTLQFVEGRPGYAVSIALVSRDGRPQLGVVYDPVKETLYHALKDGGAFRNNREWRLKVDPGAATASIKDGGAVMNGCWVLERTAACFGKKPKPEQGGGCLWDYAAIACLFEQMGAWVSDSFGQPLELNRRDSLFMNHKGVLFASSQHIAREKIDTLSRFPPGGQDQ
ncbi:MAG: inositol monophosphatase [Candidatus Omnitrophica bacterium]|nr:inositol monophosphatase [Candidatus Omnitrophota bacterium]